MGVVADSAAVATKLPCTDSNCVGTVTVSQSASVGEPSFVDGRLAPLKMEGEVVLAWRFPTVTLRTSTRSEARVLFDTLTAATEVDGLLPTATMPWGATYKSVYKRF